MEWLVIDAVFLKSTGCYTLILLHASLLKIIAEVTSEIPVLPGDILCPVRNSICLINKNTRFPVMVCSAVVFSVTHWRFLNRLASRQGAGPD